MKNAMKKLLSLVLVAMLLVSAVPFQASASDGGQDYYVNVIVKLDSVAQSAVKKDIAGATTTVGNLIDWKITQDLSAYDFSHAWVDGKGELGRDGVVDSGDTVEFAFVSKPKEYSVNVIVKLDGVAQSAVKKDIAGATTTVGNLIDYKITQDLSAYNFDHAWVDGKGTLGRDGVVDAGDTVEFAFVSKSQAVEPINIVVKVESSNNVVWTGSKVPANKVSAKVEDLLTYCWNKDWDDVYTFDHAWSEEQGNVAKSGSINAGDTVYIMVNKVSSSNPSTPTTPSGNGKIALKITVGDVIKVQKYVSKDSATVNELIKENLSSSWTSDYTFNSATIDGTTYGRSDVTVKAGETVVISLTRKFSKDNSNKVYLHVFLNGNASEIAMTKDITGTYLMDDWMTSRTEILNYLKTNYYTAKDSSKALELDGLYLSENGTGTFPTKYYADDNVARIEDIDELLEDNFVHISVMLKNAKAKSSSTADSSNPKTGDTIYMTVAVMGMSVAALAAVYYVSKKRAVK